MSKNFLLLSLSALVMTSSAFADSFTCQPQDLKISLNREPQQETTSMIYPEGDKLTVTCKGHDPLILRMSSPFPASLSDSTESLSNSNFKFFSDQFFTGLDDQRQESLLKSVLATLLTAKTSGLSVTISYDSKSGYNYRDGNTIIGVAIE